MDDIIGYKNNFGESKENWFPKLDFSTLNILYRWNKTEKL
jgi:hypothetical protein